MKNKILIIDLETTGFLPNGQIVEVGIVELDIKTGEKKIIHDKVYKPDTLSEEEIDKSWIVSSGFMTTEEICQGTSIVFDITKIQKIINKYHLGATAYNRAFDFDFLESIGIKVPVQLPCPMIISTPICNIPGKWGKAKWPKVQEAYDFFFPDNEYIEQHRGANDALHEADIVFELIRLGEIEI